MSTIIEGTTNNPETAESNSIGCKLYFSSKTHHQSAANSYATIMPATATIYSLHCITFFLKNWHGLHKHQLKPRLVGPYTGIHTVLGLKIHCIKVRLSLVIPQGLCSCLFKSCDRGGQSYKHSPHTQGKKTMENFQFSSAHHIILKATSLTNYHYYLRLACID